VNGKAATNPHRVVVIGGGFGGLLAALALRDAPVELTLVDRRNFHLFQPLTYQVATGALAASDVSYPLRAIFKNDRNVRVVMAEVTGFDLAAREVNLEPVGEAPAPATLPYDSLIVAGGSAYSYFGHEEWRELAFEVKSLESALMVRRRLLSAFEAAELETDPEARRAWLTFVVVGAGPTGVEMAGQIAELARDTLPGDYREIDPRSARILLVEAGPRVLSAFDPSLSEKAAGLLEELGVTPQTDRPVVGIDEDGVDIARAGSDETERIEARTVIWAAGVTPSPLASELADRTSAELDRLGRVRVEADLTLPGHSEVFALGDMVNVRGMDLPGLAPVAMQQGRYAARVIKARLEGRPHEPFHYVDKGNLATIGRARAVAEIKKLKLAGGIAWLTWLGVHLWYLIGFQNRLLVLIRWLFSFATRGRGARLITGQTTEMAARGR
jgi:NADH:ubiquinone reductase (H+-translocating)